MAELDAADSYRAIDRFVEDARLGRILRRVLENEEFIVDVLGQSGLAQQLVLDGWLEISEVEAKLIARLLEVQAP